MYQCTICNNTYDKKVHFCSTCGADATKLIEIPDNQQSDISSEDATSVLTSPAPLQSGSQFNPNAQEQAEMQRLIQYQQQTINQMMAQQQQISSQMMAQQQQMSNQMMAQQQQTKNNNSVPVQAPPAFRIKNIYSLVAGIITLVAYLTSSFIIYYDGWFYDEEKYSIADWCSLMRLFAKDTHDHPLIYMIMSSLNILTIATIIVLLLEAFIDVSSFRSWILTLETAVFVITFLMFKSVSDACRLSSSFYILLAGIIVGLISASHSSSEKHYIYRPLGNGVSDSSLNLSAVTNGYNGKGEWRCLKCDTKNTGSVCKFCGETRRY